MFAGHRQWAIMAGVISGLLFLLAAGSMLPSLLLVYTPFLPLLAVGLMLGAPSAILASGIASGFSMALGPDVFLLYVLMFAIPVVYFVRKSLSQQALTPTHRIWFSQGLVMTDLACYAAILVAAIAGSLHETLSGNTNLGALLPPVMEGEPEALASVRSWILEKSFVILGGTAWIQLSLFYGLAVLVNFLLANRTLRPSLAVVPFMPSGWLLAGLMGAGVLSFADNPASSLAAKAAFITLLFPYFLMGLALMHRFSILWPSRRLWLSLVYFFMLVFPASVLGFIGLGLAAQARHLSNRSSGQTS